MGLSIFDGGKANCVEDAVWHWRFSFGSHWGYHIAGAINVLTDGILLTREGLPHD